MVSVAPESSASSSSRPEPSRPSAPNARSEPNGFAALVDAKAHASERSRSATAERRDSTRSPRPASPSVQDSRDAAAANAATPANQPRRAEGTTSDDGFRHEADEPSKPTKPAESPDDNVTAGRPRRATATDTATESATATPPGMAPAAIVEAVAGAAAEVDATNFTIAKTIATTPVPAAELPLTAEAQPASASRLASVVGAAAAKGIKAGDTPPVTPADPAASHGTPRPPAPPGAAQTQPHPGVASADAAPALPIPDGDRANGDSATPSTGGHHAATMASQPQPATPDAMSPPGAPPLATPQTPTVATIPAAQPATTATANLAVPVSGLAIEIAASARAGNSRFEIRLDPAELGRIDVRLDVDRHGQVTSHLTVEKPETLAMLRQDAPQLQRALEDAGLKTGESSLQFSLRDQSSGNQNRGDAERQPHRLVIGDAGVTPLAAANTTYMHAAGASRGLDIRV